MPAPRQRQAVIGLYLITNIIPDHLRLEPQHCVYLVPDSALSTSEEGVDHMLLMLRYGRSQEEVALFIQSLTSSFPLLVHRHTAYASHDHDALFRLKQRFVRWGTVQRWHIRDSITEFRTVEACMAFLRAQVCIRLCLWGLYGSILMIHMYVVSLVSTSQDIIPGSEHWTKEARKRALQRLQKYNKKTQNAAATPPNNTSANQAQEEPLLSKEDRLKNHQGSHMEGLMGCR